MEAPANTVAGPRPVGNWFPRSWIMVLLEATGGLRCRWWRLSLLRRCRWWWSTRARFGLRQGHRYAGPLSRQCWTPFVPPCQQVLAARRHQVLTMLVSEKNRLGTAISGFWLEQELNDLDEGLRQTLRRSQRRMTCPGVGEQVSLTLLAYLPELGRDAALVGWPPSTGTAAPSASTSHFVLWERWWPAATTRSSATSTRSLRSRRRWRDGCIPTPCSPRLRYDSAIAHFY